MNGTSEIHSVNCFPGIKKGGAELYKSRDIKSQLPVCFTLLFVVNMLLLLIFYLLFLRIHSFFDISQDLQSANQKQELDKPDRVEE